MPGAIHQNARGAVGGFALGNRRLDLIFVGDVGVKRHALDFGGDLFGVFLALVEHGDLRAFRGHRARGGGAEARATAGDENGNVFQLHNSGLLP